MKERKKDMVSFIITSKNEANDIADCIKSLKAQNYTNTETILIDNHSDDGTDTIAKQHNIRVEQKGPERSAQRNYGYHISSGEYVCFLDADMRAPENMATECVELMKAQNVDAVVLLK
jgi:glycosyltransferase involved in cell wall biosynthesis